MFHEKLGSSREEFLKENAPIMAQCTNFLVIISQPGSVSPFVYNETVFVEWMGRNICSILMKDGDMGEFFCPVIYRPLFTAPYLPPFIYRPLFTALKSALHEVERDYLSDSFFNPHE